MSNLFLLQLRRRLKFLSMESMEAERLGCGCKASQEDWCEGLKRFGIVQGAATKAIDWDAVIPLCLHRPGS